MFTPHLAAGFQFHCTAPHLCKLTLQSKASAQFKLPAVLPACIMLTLHSKASAKPGSVSCTLTAAELQKYPDSLLSSIVASCSTTDDEVAEGSSSSSSSVSIKLEEVPGWPSHLLQPAWAAEVITAMYR
jgi:hypothetical protein